MLQDKFSRRIAGTGLVFVAVSIFQSRSQIAIAEESSTMDNHVIEFVSFKLAAGATEEAFLKATSSTNEFLKAQQGFVARRLSKDPEGRYIDHVEWASFADAESAAKAFMAQEDLAPFMQMIDPASMTMRHNVLLVSL